MNELFAAAALAEVGDPIVETTASTLSAILENTTTVVTSFAGMINSVFSEAASNPVAIISLGITITFAAIGGVRRIVKAFKGVR